MRRDAQRSLLLTNLATCLLVRSSSAGLSSCECSMALTLAVSEGHAAGGPVRGGVQQGGGLHLPR